MTRLAPLSPPYPPAVQADFDRIMRGAPPLMLFRVLAGHERAWEKFRAGSLLDGRVLTLRQREIVIDRTCALTGCEYEWGVHVTTFAAAARLDAQAIKATVSGAADDPAWTREERALIAAVDALRARATLSDAECADLRRDFDEDQILEVLLLAGFYRTVAYIANGLALPLEPGAARFADVA
jgi:alkylhydroperoxidase family enzyme